MTNKTQTRIRGLLPGDDEIFDEKYIIRLQAAQTELQFLLDKGYPMKSAATFVCNHHQLSGRQALALTRATALSEALPLRERKRLLPEALKGQPLHIDGFNLFITLEVALSDGMLFVGQDDCIRDLAELRGSYRLIGQTRRVIDILQRELAQLGISQAIIMLDEPVSNSGRLKSAIYDNDWAMPVDVQIVRNPDALLKHLPHVVTSDAVIIDECQSWFNLAAYLISTCDEFKHLTRLVQLNEAIST